MTNAPTRPTTSDGSELSIMEKIGNARLLTGDEGRVKISSDDRRYVAVFDNNVVILAGASQFDSRVRMVIKQARANDLIGAEIDYITTETAILVGLYKKFGRGSGEVKTESIDIERQAQMAGIIKQAADRGASDVHMLITRDYTEVRYRLFGRVLDMMSLSVEDGKALVRATFAVASDTGNSSSDTSFQQGALTVRSGILPAKVNLVRLQYSPTTEGRGTLVSRLIYVTKAGETEIDALGYSQRHIDDIVTMRKRTNGLYIIAGKTSSGKSTTLQRVLNKMYMEKKREISMFSIEEPVELDLPGATQIAAKKAPDGTDGFIEAMKAALRSDPDIIVLGETRSEELANLAIKAVMSGHAVWSTVHAGSALGILDRLSDFGVDSWKLVDPTVVRGLIYQRLIGVMCPHCKITMAEAVETGSMTKDLADRCAKLFETPTEVLTSRGPGCEKCISGFVGRTVVAESVQTDAQLLELFSQGKRSEMRRYWLESQAKGGMGGNPVLHHALVKVGAGICDIENVEEGVDLLSSYERDFLYLQPRLLEEVAAMKAKV